MLSKCLNKGLRILKQGLPQSFKLNSFSKINRSLTYSSYKRFSEEKVADQEEPELIETNKEQYGFKAETKKLLDIVTHSLYTDKEIFLRELLSNCSDALEKQRYLEVTGQLQMTGEPLFISINTNEKNKTVTIFDSGVGMNRNDMIENLGTIAKSGTQAFVKSIQEKQKQGTGNESLIGQFGVGFYSSFIVGDTVEVISKPQNESKAYHWVSDGSGEFQISDIENVDFKRGTRVTIHLKTECRDFCKTSELQKIIKKYSNFISYTIKVNGEVVNNVQAIWYREKKDVSSEEYQKFYEMLSNSKLPYKYLLHFASDVPLDIKALLFFPSQSMEKYGMNEENVGLSLYSKKILIKQKCIELLPNYFRFIKGVVDCADIPLSISRESYQDSSLIFKLRVLITKRIIKKLEDEMKLDGETYDKWYEEFSHHIREGILTDSDNADVLMKLMRFNLSIKNKREKSSLEDYVKKMKEGQDKIYYLVTPEKDNEFEDNIYLESYKNQDVPILIASTPLDEMIFKQKQFKNFKFVNIENESDDFLNKCKDETSNDINKIPEEEVTPFTLWIKNELEPYVSKVTVSRRLKDSPLLVTSQYSSQMKILMNMVGQEKSDALRECFVEINPSHNLILNLNTLRKEDPRIASMSIKHLFDTAVLHSGMPLQSQDFAKRTYKLINTLLNDRLNSQTAQIVDEPVERIKTESFKDLKNDVKTNTDLFSDYKLKD